MGDTKQEAITLKSMGGTDTVSGSLAECIVTIEGKSYNFMQLIKFEAKMEKSVTEIPVLGRTGKVHKASGWKGTWTGTAHYNQSIMRKLLENYKNTGKETPFTIQIVNQDEGSSAGAQDVSLLGCLTSGGILAKFDATAEYLEEEISGTFDDFVISTAFSAGQLAE